MDRVDPDADSVPVHRLSQFLFDFMYGTSKEEFESMRTGAALCKDIDVYLVNMLAKFKLAKWVTGDLDTETLGLYSASNPIMPPTPPSPTELPSLSSPSGSPGTWTQRR